MGEPLTETELDIMMKDADKNKDGKIDYEGNCIFSFTGTRAFICCTSVKRHIYMYWYFASQYANSKASGLTQENASRI